MAMDLDQLPARVAEIRVHTPRGYAGLLTHDTQYRFDTSLDGEPVSLTMPVRTRPYTRGALHPVFEMNLPEGYVRHYIFEKLQRFTRVNDMLLLALQGEHGVGRLRYESSIHPGEGQALSLAELLSLPGGPELFAELLERYLFNGQVSGVQPKVLVNDSKSALIQPSLIVKSAGEDYPLLAQNEWVCMSLAKAVGLPVPQFWLSDNRALFIMQRFDIEGDRRLGMEDFAVLSGLSAQSKYQGSYENAARILSLFDVDPAEYLTFFDSVALSCLLGNGDAHLKNFALLYDDPQARPRLAPAYDIVCTRYYPELGNRLALKMDGSNAFPDKKGLLRFARTLGIKEGEHRVDRLATLALETLADIPLDSDAEGLRTTIRESVDQVMATRSSGARFRGRTAEDGQSKPRKIDSVKKPK
jgi:serine/threonine-protein kinase HipA